MAAWWGLPQGRVFEPVTVRTFWRRVDWVGAGLVSTSLGMFFYVLAYGPLFKYYPPHPRHGNISLVVIYTQALFVLALLAVRN